MAKKELTLEQALEQLEKQKHLAEAVASKDAEIAGLKAQLKEVTGQVKTQVHLGDAVAAKDSEIVKLTGEIVELKRLQANHLGEKETLEQNVKVLEEQLKKTNEQARNISDIANGYINNFRSTLKSIQGTLEVAVELEALLTEKINKKP